MNILDLRLQNQLLLNSENRTPAEVVSHFGAMQSQDFLGAKWAIGARLPGLKEADVEKAFNEGFILRTHIMRPTWHFVVPDDIGWMQELTAEKVRRALGYYDKRQGVEQDLISKSLKLFEKALSEKASMTKADLIKELSKNNLTVNTQMMNHLLMHGELNLLLCSGPIIGKQQSYSLLGRRVPKVKTMEKDEALTLFARKYFQSHGPATLADFVWWSGLTTSEARAAIAGQSELEEVTHNDNKFFYFPKKSSSSSGVWLLPNFDEYTVAYRDRSDLVDGRPIKLSNGFGFLAPVVVYGGKVIGTWGRKAGKNSIEVSIKPLENFDIARELIQAGAEMYGSFLDRKVVVKFSKD